MIIVLVAGCASRERAPAVEKRKGDAARASSRGVSEPRSARVTGEDCARQGKRSGPSVTPRDDCPHGSAARAVAEWTCVPQPDLARRVADAPELAAESVCVPVRATRREPRLFWVPNPDGRTWDVIQVYFACYKGPTTLVIMDLGAHITKTVQIPKGMPTLHLTSYAVAPNGKMFLSTSERDRTQGLSIYDPATNEFSYNAVDMPDDMAGEEKPMCLGTDGMLYVATGHKGSRRITIARVDPDTLRITYYGPVGPDSGGGRARSIAADDRCVYVDNGRTPWMLLAFDRTTRAAEVLATTRPPKGFVGLKQYRDGCWAKVNHIVGTDKSERYWLYHGTASFAGGPKPWPEPETVEAWTIEPPKPEVWLHGADPASNGSAAFWYRAPGGGDWRALRYRVPTYPVEINRLTELPDGRLFGSVSSYQGYFVYDPRTGTAEHLGKLKLSHYATVVRDDAVYLSGYSHAPLFRYDPSRPWNATPDGAAVGEMRPGAKLVPLDDPRANPRFCGHVDRYSRCTKMYSCVAAADGRIYLGGIWMRDGNGGGVEVWDPARRASVGGFWRELSTYQVKHMTTAGDGRYVVVSTRRATDTVLRKEKPAQGRLFVLDSRRRGEVIHAFDTVPEAQGPGLVADAGNNRVLAWTNDPNDRTRSYLSGVNVVAGREVFRKHLPFPISINLRGNMTDASDFRRGPDGFVWTFMNGNRTLVRIDPRDASVHAVATVGWGGKLAFHGRDVYLTNKSELRRLRDVVRSGASRPSLISER